MIGLAKEWNGLYYLEKSNESFVSFLSKHHLFNKEKKYDIIIIDLNICHLELLRSSFLLYLGN